MKKAVSVAVSAALASVMVASSASAHVSDAEWAAFKAKFEEMSNRVQALEQENQQLRSDSASAGSTTSRTNVVTIEDLDATNAKVASLDAGSSAGVSTWTDTINLKGDFRYRFEEIQVGGETDRNRQRIRARVALVAKPSATTELGLALASGSDDPISTNQTLGSSGTSKGINLQLAYVKWTGLENTYISAGKIGNPFYRPQKSGLIWDSDYAPEGFAVGWANDMFFASATYAFIESDSKKDDDGIFGAQIGGTFELVDGMQLTAAAKYLDIPTQGRRALFNDGFFGNSSVMASGEEVYAFDYKIFNASVELGMQAGDLPLSVYADYINNNEADDLETGYIVGINLGKAKNKGSWQARYQYQLLEADATLGLITDSDFAGGGTDGEGHKFTAIYALDKHWTIGATYFDADTGIDLGSDADYQRIQFDTILKY